MSASTQSSARFGILLLHSTAHPERVVSALRALNAAAAAGKASRPVLVLDDDGVRLAAKGVADTLGGGGRPDVRALLESAQRAGTEVHAVVDAWRERGFADDALVPGAALAGADVVARLALAGCAFVTY